MIIRSDAVPTHPIVDLEAAVPVSGEGVGPYQRVAQESGAARWRDLVEEEAGRVEAAEGGVA